MDYGENKEILREFYFHKGLTDNFENDSHYLERAFHATNKIWFGNLNRIQEVKYIMIAEAPLWGKDESYFYNPKSVHSQFFYKNDLDCILNDTTICDKRDFIDKCNEIGLVIIDVSPFALNREDTAINYMRKSKKKNPSGLTKSEYRLLIKDTIPTFFEKKINAIVPMVSEEVKIFFRYPRVRDRLQDVISDALIRHDIINSASDISSDIFLRGGGIDRIKFSRIINRGSDNTTVYLL